MVCQVKSRLIFSLCCWKELCTELIRVKRLMFQFFLLECKSKRVDSERARRTSGIKQWSVHEMAPTSRFQPSPPSHSELLTRFPA